ncbi:MAG: hypothetical protein HY711_00435 [Candidatus Melainabacteria bacterium]|nr:hypothetical protein [Candidatus Melainabacteria bacterium]
MMRQHYARKQKGQGLLEVLAVGTAVMIPLALLFLDGLTLVGVQAANNTYAKRAARALADKVSKDERIQALEKLQQSFKSSQVITSLDYQLSNDATVVNAGKVVTVKTSMTVALPVPIPGVDKPIILVSKAVEPITGEAPTVITLKSNNNTI